MSLKLNVVIGPTVVGKTDYALALAEEYQSPIVSADSRQIFSGMCIGTAAPSVEEQRRIKHYFLQVKSPADVFSAVNYAEEATALVQRLFQTHNHLVMVGGSMLYLKHFLEGYDLIPPVNPNVRQSLWQRFEADGIAPLRNELLQLDPEYLKRIDPNNHKRIIRALEVYHTTGKPFTSYHGGQKCKRHPFDVELHYLTLPRPQLYQRIEARVEGMFQQGLLQEVEALLPFRTTTALNTIGYKELFDYIDQKVTLDEAKRLIIKHTKTYARQQIRYFEKHWIQPNAPFPYRIITPQNT